jgi:group I intron endonuclease
MSNFTTNHKSESIAKIYIIENLINHRKYIGFTTASLQSRWRKHVYSAKKSKYYLHRAIRKYGKENFSIAEIYSSKNVEHTLHEMEPFFIKQFDTYENGYNMTIGGEGIIGCRSVRHPHSPETIQKMKDGWTPERRAEASKRFSELPRTDEHNARIAAAHKGCKKSPEAIEKHRKAMTGRKLSADQIQKMRERVVTEETRMKMSKAKKGQPQSSKSVEKRAAANRGQTRTPHQIEANRQTQLALHRKHTETEIQKMKNARRLYLEHNESNATKNWILWHKNESTPFFVRNLEKWAAQKGLRGDSLQKVAKGIRNSDHGYRVWREDKCPEEIKCSC